MWGKLPFLAVLIGIFGVYSGNAFGDGDVKSCDSGWWWNGSFCQQCPTGFNKSKPNANKRQDCYFESEGTQKFYGTKTCSAGQYLPKDSASCTYCYSRGKWCPGGTYAIYQSYSQGMYSCPDDYPNTSFDGDKSTVDSCYNSTWIGDFHYNCSSGKWYNTITRRCNNECPTNYNKSEKNKSIRPEDCKSPSGAHYSKKCPAGQYLPKNKNIEDGCTTCPNDRVCPGGYFTSFIPYEDQGIFKCPIGYKKSGNTCVVGGENPTIPPEQDDPTEPPTPEDPNGDDPTGDRLCDDAWYKDPQFGCIKCQAGFTHSDADATKASQCWDKDINGKTMYYKYVNGAGTSADPKPCDSTANCTKCPEGTFVAKQTNWCSPCPSGKICRGGWFLPHMNADNGVSDKDSHGCVVGMNGEYWDNAQGKCVKCPWSEQFYYSTKESTSVDQCYALLGNKKLYYKKVSCDAGKYLPKGNGYNNQNNSNGCITCPGDDTVNYCPRITNKRPSLTEDQGLYPCTDGKVPSGDHKTCETPGSGNGGGDNIGSEFTCSAGFYLPAYGGGCQKCTITTKYCPGGKYKVGTTDRGIFDCPTGGVVTSDWKSCDIKLSKIKMKFGPNGTSTKLTDQCWLKTNIRDYAKCIFENSGSNNPYIHDNYKNEYEIETYNPNAPADS